MLIEVSEGRTGNYFVYGIGVIVLSFILIGIGLASSLLILLLGIVFFILSILMFLATNGLEVSKGQYRRYTKLAGVKLGSWENILMPQSVLLSMHAENGSKEFGVMVAAYVPSMNSKVISYDIVLEDEFQKKTLVYEFLDYKIAKKALKEISDKYKISSKNQVAEKMAENKLKRGRR